jgi:hypothetical protein
MKENTDQSFEQTDQVAGVGSLVTIDLIDRSGQIERLSLQIVPDASADFSKGFLGQGTPLARAIQGRSAGSLVPYSVGDMRQVRILSVQPALSSPPTNIDARRQETINKAIEDSERTSAIIFASSYTGKWGDYDPGAIENQKGHKEDGKT